MKKEIFRLEDYLAQETEKYRGTGFPVKASVLRRLLVKSVPCKSLHPNPEDEFCVPSIGPNYGIISDYERKFRKAQKHLDDFRDSAEVIEPIVVEKIHPDGYMILNGHHRWAAALRTGQQKIRVKIVNLTQEKDIEQMLRASQHDRRVTLDLDEVVFCKPEDGHCEKPLRFPWRVEFPERLRRGVPALLRFFRKSGYDVWVYTARYDSMDRLQRLFRMYHASVDGVITGTQRKARKGAREQMERLAAGKYVRTVHIDNEAAVCIDSRNKSFEEHKLSGNPATWSAEIMDIIGAGAQHE